LSAPDERLESELRALKTVLSWPEPEDLAPLVSRRLSAGESRRGWPPAVLIGLAAALILMLLAGTFAALPGLRSAVAGWLGLRGVRIERTEPGRKLPSPAPKPDFGVQVTLHEADDAVPFELLIPARDRRLEAYLDGDAVSLVRRAPTGEAELIITQFEGGLERALLHKVLGPGSRLAGVEVDGNSGYWITGSLHTVLYIDPSGAVREDTVRLAGNTLLWEQGRLTLRVEGAGSLASALAIARSLD
jgi:hypothetical protein